MGKVVCPKCEKDDQIQKVTSIVTGGISTTTYGGNTAVSMTNLASRLSPPKNSKLVNGFGMWFITWIIALALCGFILSLFIEPITAWIIGGIVSGVFVWWGHGDEVKKHDEFEKELQSKMKNYGELYYCYRDDCVFDPNTNKTAPPENLEHLL
jgi:hypothetical protein